jgi:RimJ/RimL family protein N-acetyltransferase
MAYGFTSLGLHRISADTTSPNVASWRLMERLGMRREAHLREAEFRDGEWIDYFIYAILVHEWMAH